MRLGQPDPDQHETTHADSVLGFGGVVFGPDGVARPMPEHQALATAILQWVKLAEHVTDTRDACLQFATHQHPDVRAACVRAFGDLVRRYGRMAEQARVVRALELGLRDRDDEVRHTAVRSADIVEETLGWHILRPVV